jgi:MerR family mercuric resistance operon transcriptional regulator
MDDKVRTKPFTAGELARAASVSTDTLRHYERKGVIGRPLRGANGYRQYPPATLNRVRLVRRALGIGFTLDELAAILKLRERGGTPCREVRRLAGEKLATMEERLQELMELRDELRATLKEWDARLAKTAKGNRAGLLETLPPRAPRRNQSAAKFSTNNKRKMKQEK